MFFCHRLRKPVKIPIASKNISETKPNTKRNLVAHKQDGPWRRPFAGRHKFLSFGASLWTETGNDPNTSRVQLHLNTPRNYNHSTRPRHETAQRCHPGHRDTRVSWQDTNGTPVVPGRGGGGGCGCLISRVTPLRTPP